MTTNLRQQIIEDRLQQVATSLGIDPDLAFLRDAHELITGRSVHDFDDADLVEGGQDKQIDVITIIETDDSADVYVLQVKNTSSFGSNALIRLGNGLSWLFERERNDVKELGNTSLKDKIFEYRSVQSSVGPSNLRLHVHFVAKGSTSELSPEFKQELEVLRSKYSNDVFEVFEVSAIGSDELTKLARAQERQTRRIDADIKVRYDANTPSLIKYYAQDLKGIVCTVPASEIANLVLHDAEGAIFDLNIRRFLGTRGAVNRDIVETCTDASQSYEFWFLNNGITMVCDRFDAVTDPDNPHLKLTNLQIVNGCQTAKSLALAKEKGELAPDVRVLTRVYETDNPELVQRIVLTTIQPKQD